MKLKRQPILRPDGCYDIPLTKGKFATIDACDLDHVMKWSWHACNPRREHRWYAGAGTVNKKLRLHRYLLGNPASLVDHRDGDGLNNRRSNLRVATNSQNQFNMRRKTTPGRTPFKGVAPNGPGWCAMIGVKGQRLYVGQFRAAEDAARAYDDAARKHFGEFACVNFPRPGERCARVA